MVLRIEVNYEAVVEQVARVALLAVGVEHLHAGVNVMQTLNEKALLVIYVVPGGLLGQAVVEHVCKRRQNVSLGAVNVQAEYPAAHYRPGPAEVAELILAELLAGQVDAVVVALEVVDFFVDLDEEGGADELREFGVAEVDGEVGVVLRQQLQVQPPRRLLALQQFLQQEDGQVRVFGGHQLHLLAEKLSADWVFPRYFQSYQPRLGHEDDCLVLLICERATLIGCVLTTPR